MTESEPARRDIDLLIVRPGGRPNPTSVTSEPYQLIDARGAVIDPVAIFRRELLAVGRAPATLRSYGMDLLRCWRFLEAVDVGWNQATQVEARDFNIWIQITAKKRRPDGVSTNAALAKAAAKQPNSLTGKPSPGPGYAPSTVTHSETVLRTFYDSRRDEGGCLRMAEALPNGDAGRDRLAWWTLRGPWRPLTYHAAHRMFERANAMLGSNWTLHDLRHSAAARMVRDPEMKITDIQQILGHTHLSTTKIYLAPDKDEVIQAAVAHYARAAERRAESPPPPAPGYDPNRWTYCSGGASDLGRQAHDAQTRGRRRRGAQRHRHRGPFSGGSTTRRISAKATAGVVAAYCSNHRRGSMPPADLAAAIGGEDRNTVWPAYGRHQVAALLSSFPGDTWQDRWLASEVERRPGKS